MRNYSIYRRLPSYPARANRLMKDGIDYRETAQAFAQRRSAELGTGAVIVDEVVDTRIVAYWLYENGNLTKHGRETTEGDWKSWQHEEYGNSSHG